MGLKHRKENNMVDKVQKIREEVKKLKSKLMYGACSSQIAMETRCKEEAYNEVLALLDSLQEEPTGNPLGSTHAEFRTAVESLGISQEEHDRIVDECIYGKEPELVDADDLPKEEPASEIDFEQELYKAFGQVKDFTLGMRIAKWFYDMGKNNREHVSEDLEEASKEWLRPQLDKSYANYGETKMMELTRFDGYAMLEAIEFGAKWQKAKDQSTIELAEDHAMLAGMEKMKQQMMKEPNLSGYVARDEDGNLHIFEVEPRRLEEKHQWWDRDYSCHIIDNDAFPDLRWKDEPICVKLIIIKED